MPNDYADSGGSFGENVVIFDDGSITGVSADRTATNAATQPQRNRYPISTNSEVVYTSYAGVDIVATIVLDNQTIELGELQTISYSTHRENLPVRTLGHVSPIGFVKGGRTIGGSMIFTTFNNYAFYRLEHFQNGIKKGLYPVADMLPPLDIVLTFSNETGAFSKMKLMGLTFIDEGGVMSVDDIMSESTFQYMARGIQPITGYSMPESN